MSFSAAASFVLQEEGSEFVDDPSDPGGPTRYGISLKNHPTLTLDDIRNMTPEKARAIYFSEYFEPIQGNSWPDVFQLPLLDAAILQGPVRAVEFMQTALYVSANGKVGPATLGAARRASVKPVLARFTAQRIESFSQASDWRKAGAGWSARAVFAVLSTQSN